MHPPGGRLINRAPAKATFHCLLIESEKGLILIDSGFGVDDMEKNRRLSPIYFSLQLNVENTAIRQIKKLGYNAKDVKHIIMTHLDCDHAGGLTDFPNAEIHIFHLELKAAMQPKGFIEKNRYRKSLFKHSPKWVVYDTISDNKWYGMDCIRNLKNLPEDIVMIPLAGHTRGHCGVAVKSNDRWLLHTGDAYFYDLQMGTPPETTPGFILLQHIIHINHRAAMKTKKLLWNLANEHKDEIKLFCSHDPSEFEYLSNTKLS